MGEQLSALDATFLELEEADETAHMHIGAAMVFEPLPGGGAPSLDAVRAAMEQRMVALPRYRQRLSERHIARLHWPSWEDDPSFDVANHMYRAALPAPGGRAELLEWLAEFWSVRLDRGRPLWETVLLEGLEDGRWAFVSKTHHCMIDGVSNVDVAYVMLDTEPDPPEREWKAPPPADHDGHGRLRGAASGLAHLADPRHLPDLVRLSREAVSLIVRDEVIGAPHTSLNEPMGTRRRIGVVEADLEELKAIKRALGGHVNDVALAVVTGGLRRLLLLRGEEPPPQGLRAMVPVDTRTAGEHMKLGNRVSSLFAHLPVGESDVFERYRMCVRETERLKRAGEAEGGEAVVHVFAHTPPVLHSVAAQSLFATRLFNVTVTNVPGPRDVLYAFGAPMSAVYGLVPLAAAHSVGVAIVSYAGDVTFTVNADHDRVPDLDVMVAGMEQSLAELRTALARE